MTAAIYVFAIVVTLAALAHIASTDPKRRRVSGLPALEGSRRVRLMLFTALLPGILLAITGDGAGFVIWLGTTTIVGWGVAAMPPAQSARLGRWLAFWTRRIARSPQATISIARSIYTQGYAIYTAPRQIAALQERVSALETLLAVEQGQGAGNTMHPNTAVIEALEPKKQTAARTSRAG